MKYILIISSILLVQCCTGNKTHQTSAISTDTSSGIIGKDTQTAETGTKVEPTSGSDTIPVKPQSPTERPGTIDLEYGRFHTSAIPECLRSYVKKIMDDEVKNPPQKIYSYRYKGNTV